jgi:MtN3 and saliva related transmembrane protein
MTGVELTGHLAGVLTTLSASPQLIYSYRTRDVASFDLKFLLMLAAGLYLWAVYGVLIHSLPIVVFNLIGGSLWLPIIVMKIAHIRAEGRRNP